MKKYCLNASSSWKHCWISQLVGQRWISSSTRRLDVTQLLCCSQQQLLKALCQHSTALKYCTSSINCSAQVGVLYQMSFNVGVQLYEIKIIGLSREIIMIQLFLVYSDLIKTVHYIFEIRFYFIYCSYSVVIAQLSSFLFYPFVFLCLMLKFVVSKRSFELEFDYSQGYNLLGCDAMVS